MTGSLILIVDDEWMNRDLLENILTAYDFETIIARSGEQAIETALTKQPDLIIMDVRMPGMGGYEACKQIKTNEKTAHIPVVMISGLENNLEERQQAKDAQADDLLPRTMPMNEFIKRISLLLSGD